MEPELISDAACENINSNNSVGSGLEISTKIELVHLMWPRNSIFNVLEKFHIYVPKTSIINYLLIFTQQGGRVKFV